MDELIRYKNSTTYYLNWIRQKLNLLNIIHKDKPYDHKYIDKINEYIRDLKILRRKIFLAKKKFKDEIPKDVLDDIKTHTSQFDTEKTEIIRNILRNLKV